MNTFFSLFSGFDLAGCGAQAAGLEVIGGIEIEPAIAEVAQANGHPVTVADVCRVDFKRFESPSHLWMSPVCKNASIANSGAVETELDRECGRACARAISTWGPAFVFLENVWGYRHFDAFGIILHQLKQSGYGFDYWHINAADFAVPQTRKRLILVARRDGLKPTRPMPTHSRTPGMFMERWIGWYEAIEDLIPTLPESAFAPWQLQRLGDFWPNATFLQMTGATSSLPETGGNGVKPLPQPAGTITPRSSDARAFLYTKDFLGKEIGDWPQPVIQAIVESVLLDGFGNVSRELTAKGARHPAWPSSVPCLNRERGMPRAFLCDGQTNKHGESMTVRGDGEPCFTIAASNERRPARAWLEYGRVVKMTPRALARFMGLPDAYKLPDSNALACTGIGNGCCPPLVAEIIRQVTA